MVSSRRAKPFDNDELRALVGRALDLTGLARENRYLRQEVASQCEGAARALGIDRTTLHRMMKRLALD